jgi:hypothetical protein
MKGSELPTSSGVMNDLLNGHFHIMLKQQSWPSNSGVL